MKRSLSVRSMAVLGVVAGDEVVEVGALQLVFFQCEVLVGSEIVNPELFGPRLFLRRLAVEEQHVGLHALGVEDARRQAQQRVNVSLLEQLAANGLTRAAFKQHVIRHDDRRSAMLFEDREDVLEKVELLVAGRRPEVVAVDRQAFLLRLAFLVDDGHAALLAERRIGHHHLVIFAAVAAERVANFDGHLVRAVRADAVQQHIHAAQPCHAVDQLDAVESFRRQSLFLLTVQLIPLGIGQVVVDRQKKSARAAGRIADRHLRLGPHHVDDRRDQRARRKILPRPALHVRRVLLQQTFISVALHIGGQRSPLFFIDQIDDQPPELRRVLDLVLRLAEDDAEHALLFAERLQQMAIMNFQLVAVLGEQAGPVEAFGNGRPFVEWRPALLVRHLEKQQKRQLLDVIAIRQPVIAQDVAVVPEFLDELGGLVSHG